MSHVSHGVSLYCWWAGLLALVVGVPAVALRLTRFARLGTEVQGTVTEVRLSRWHDADSLHLVVRFTDPASEREVVGRPACGRLPLAGWPGQVVAVRYLADDPERFQVGPQTSVLDAGLTSLLLMTVGSIALVLTRWTDPDAIATSAVLAGSALALGSAALLNRRTGCRERQARLRSRGVVGPGRLVGSYLVDGGADGAHRYHPVVSFASVGGERVTGVDLSTHNRHGYPSDGRLVTVRHHPHDPLLFRIDNLSRPSSERAAMTTATVGLVAMLACCGALITVGETLTSH
ncbi:DUF3592 domain-containing protein [Kitasatospora sp. RB6PN24]|uniref:DUF3592 domain-containing protein n=1 Tax=Kitasatospora humi TaxID=2893891 RepID=UPI001E54634A|nr:DUF3592 domain-containing protein [Kitasatospora humi]MCC9309299.1 DUF3592 domain-containing protein [Kitasatospora humi]